MKYLFKRILIFFLLAYVFSFLTNLYIENTTPKFINILVKQMQDDKELMNFIGGYNSFEYSYNSNEYEKKDSLYFEGIIKGNEKRLYFKGFAKKINQPKQGNDKVWQVVSIQKEVK
jgi:hypothetical protein